MKKLLQSPLFSSLLGGCLFLATLCLLAVTGSTQPRQENVTLQEAPIWNAHNPEIDQLVSQLKTERDELQERETNVAKLEEEMKAERLELDELTQRLKNLQAEFDRNTVQIKADEQTNLKKQAKIYLNMSPEAASQVLAEMEDEAVVKILGLMKEEESATILEGLLRRSPDGAKKVAAISAQLRKVLVEKTAPK